MRIGELLLAAKLVTEDQVARAIQLQREHGGRLGQHLIDIGALTETAFERFLGGIPREPATLEETGIDGRFLSDLMFKMLFARPGETLGDLAHWMKLSPKIVSDLIDNAVRAQLLSALGAGGSSSLVAMRYELTEAGKRRAQEATARTGYLGPAPISLETYSHWISRQKLTNETIDPQSVSAAFGDLETVDELVDQIGPAVSAGRALLMYGPPGNGKTSIAQRLDRVFRQAIYVPYAVQIDGQIMTVFDPDIHRPVDPDSVNRPRLSSGLVRDEADARFVACWRPFVITGGELTMEMLDLKHEPNANFYAAPLHIKAAGGCMMIDDFGRQMVSPTALLNRWIVPLENRVDYLKLHTGKSFKVPFEAMVIFSTNLEPSDLMDPAFLRRIPYKLEIAAPAVDIWRRIFESVAAARGLGGHLSDELFAVILRTLTVTHEVELAAFQPKFIIDQLISACQFRGLPLDFHRDLIETAIGNLVVGRTGSNVRTMRTLAKVA